jgi:UDP-2,3-diacylglucosamine pyrophosphatase LpxH
MASHPLARSSDLLDPAARPLFRGRPGRPITADFHPDDAVTPAGKLRFRTVWISDTHLGTSGCNAELLHDFLQSIKPETLYLVGDIIDGWRLKRGWYWPARHNDIVRRVLKLANKGTRVVYIPGNHDEAARDYVGLAFGGVEVMAEAIHTTVDGRQFLVLHGDEFDGVVLYARWLAFLGDIGYTLLLRLNVWFNALRRQFGLPYWSLSAYIKHRVKNAVAFISQYEQVVAEAARQRGVDGVVCGHIHCAEIRDFDGILYMNDGDWVESCTALVEHFDGRIEIIDWARHTAGQAGGGPADAPARAEPPVTAVALEPA